MAWKKGQSGNPGGRPKKSKLIEELAQKALEKGKENLAIKGLLANAQHAERVSDSNKAWEILMAYAYGKPRQRVELAGDKDSPVAVVFHMPDNGR